jgi:hypothetical protein
MDSSSKAVGSRICCPLLVIAVGLALGAIALVVIVREQSSRTDVARAWAEATATVMAQLTERSLQSLTISLDDTIRDIETAWDAGIPPGLWLNGRYSALIDAMPNWSQSC